MAGQKNVGNYGDDYMMSIYHKDEFVDSNFGDWVTLWVGLPHTRDVESYKICYSIVLVVIELV